MTEYLPRISKVKPTTGFSLGELRQKRIVVTGGTGFFGKNLIRILTKLGCQDISTFDSEEFDLVDPMDTYCNPFQRAQVVFHLAGHNGGIQFNHKYPYDIFYRNSMMAMNVIEMCRKALVQKVVSVVASCAYPSVTNNPNAATFVLGSVKPNQLAVGLMNEYDFVGPDMAPHESVACHGFAKRNLQLISSFAHKQYGLDAVCVCPTTMYGPHDSFDPDRTKVMGGLIKKFVTAKQKSDSYVELMGTGSALREFVYVDDAAKATVMAACCYENHDQPLNIGGFEISIRELAEFVKEIVGYEGEIRFNGNKDQDGQYRKALVCNTLQKMFPDLLLNATSLPDGIRKTVEWYMSVDD